MATGIELFHADGKTSGVFYCSVCRIVYATQQEANECHGERLCACGNPCARHLAVCNECWTKRSQAEQQQKESARFEKATKIPSSTYGGYVYAADRYFPSVEDALDHYDSTETPEYFWACKNVGVRKAKLDWVTATICENMWEDADESDLNGIEELQAALDKFNDANKSVAVYEVDYSTAIVLCEAPATYEAVPHA